MACCLFAQYSKDGPLPSVAGAQTRSYHHHKREDGWYSRNNPLSYAEPSSVAAKYESDDRLIIIIISKSITTARMFINVIAFSPTVSDPASKAQSFVLESTP